MAIKLHLVVDGPRDDVVVEHIVRKVIGEIDARQCTAWKDIRLHGHGKLKGYGRKLKYVCRQARAAGIDGVVATVDRDKETPRARLKQLKKARDEDREKEAAFPTALGEAAPRMEAWVIDDRTAVRRVLELGEDVPIPRADRVTNAKEALAELIDLSEKQEEARELLEDIAEELSPETCQHNNATGLKAFVKDVRTEFSTALT